MKPHKVLAWSLLLALTVAPGTHALAGDLRGRSIPASVQSVEFLGMAAPVTPE